MTYTEEDIEMVETVMSHFKPLTEEEQKLVLFITISCICEHYSFEKDTNGQPKPYNRGCIDTHQLYENLLTYSPELEKVVGSSHKQVMMNYIKQEYNNFLSQKDTRVAKS